MPMDDWRDSDRRRDLHRPPPSRLDPRPEPRTRPADDYGQADYSERYGYDPRTRSGYRADVGGPDRERYDSNPFRPDVPPRERSAAPEPRSFDRDPPLRRDDERGGYGDERAREMRRRDAEAAFAEDRDTRRERDRHAGRSRRDGPSDRVLWAVIMERLDLERRLDLRDVDVDVRDGEVTLNGLVRRKEDKRRIEDVADIDGVRHVQNNLRVRERDRGWTFL